MKVLAIEKEIQRKAEDLPPSLLQSEAKHVWHLYQQGLIRELYFRQDRSEAVIILECKTKEEATEVLQSLPLVQAGIISFEVIPLVPYPGFSRLFQ